MGKDVWKSWNFVLSISHLPFIFFFLVCEGCSGCAWGSSGMCSCRQRGWKMKPYLCTVNWPHPGAHRDLELPCIKKKSKKRARFSSAASLPLLILSSPQLFPQGLISHSVRDIRNRRNPNQSDLWSKSKL